MNYIDGRSTSIRWSKHTEDLLYGRVMYRDLIEKKWLFKDLIDRVKGIRQVGEAEIREINVPIAEIHCPRVDGCKTVFTLSSENTLDYSFKITILGFGGGSGESVSFGRTAQIPAEGACLKYLVPIVVKIIHCEKDGVPFSRADIIEIKNGHTVSSIPERDDDCRRLSRSAEAMELCSEHYHYDAEGVFSGEIEINAGKKQEWEWGLTALLSKTIGTEISFKGSVESLKTITYRYELVGKHHYIGYNAPGSLGYCWEWERI